MSARWPTWLLHKGEHIIPIPGTTRLVHLQDNLGAVNVKIGADVMACVKALVNEKTVLGSRYNEQGNREVDTEVF